MPIKMTPDEYYWAFTLGNYHEFMNDKSSVMKAFNSAVSASHLADCYFNFYEKNNPKKIVEYKNLIEFINYISQNTNLFFKDIRSIANAYKHLYTGSNEKNSNYSSISSAGIIEVVAFETEDINQISEEITELTSELNVVYTRKTGEQFQYIEAIESVIRFWEKLIY